jgi:hypothetical protein
MARGRPRMAGKFTRNRERLKRCSLGGRKPGPRMPGLRLRALGRDLRIARRDGLTTYRDFMGRRASTPSAKQLVDAIKSTSGFFRNLGAASRGTFPPEGIAPRRRAVVRRGVSACYNEPPQGLRQGPLSRCRTPGPLTRQRVPTSFPPCTRASGHRRIRSVKI